VRPFYLNLTAVGHWRSSARSPSCLDVTSQSSGLDLCGRPDDLHQHNLTSRFRVETGLANVLRKEAVADVINQEN
jgi:hypothetical protein